MKLIKLTLMLAMLLILAVGVQAINVGNCTDLQDMDTNLSGDYVLTGNIDCSATTGWNSGEGFIPIGNTTDQFTGTLDGAGYTISNLFINRSDASQAIFGDVNLTGFNEIYNFTIDNASINGGGLKFAVLVGGDGISDYYFNDMTIINSEVNSGNNGGILSANKNSGANFYVNNIVINDSEFSGGIRGAVIIPLTNGATNANFTNIDINNVTLSGTRFMAGLIGQVGGDNNLITIDNVSVDATITSTGHSNGGLIGSFQSASSGYLHITNSYTKGSLKGTNTQGGILGVQNQASTIHINNSYSAMTINTTDATKKSGGIIGSSGFDVANVQVNNAFVINGEVSSGSQIGGLMGLVSVGTLQVSNFYWQNTTSTATSCIGSAVSNVNCTVEDTTSSYYDANNAPMSSWSFYTSTSEGSFVEQDNDTACLNFEVSCEIARIDHATPTSSELSQVGLQTINSASYITVLTSTVEVPVTTELEVTATGDVLGSGSGSIATCRIVFDGVEIGNKTESPANNQHKSFAIQTSLANKTAGNYTLTFECRRDGSQRFDIENTELIITEYIDQNNNAITVGEDIATFTINNSAYQLYDTVEFNLSNSLPATGSIKDVVFKSGLQLDFTSTGTICYIVETGGVNSSEYCQYGEAGDSASGSYFHIDANLTTGTETEKIYAKSTTSDGSIILDSIHFEIFGDPTEQDDISFSNVSINSATYATVVNDTLELINHSSVAIITHASLSVASNSGASDMSFRLVLEGIENGSIINKDVLAINQNGLVTIEEEFENISTGNYTILLQAQADNLDATITGGELISFTSNEVIIEPIGYYVYAFSSFDGSPLSGFNVTTASDGTVYQSENGFSFVPLSVATENVTVSKTGFTSNITLNHNTSNDLSVNLTPDAPTLLLTLSPSDSEEQGTVTTATGSGCPAELTCSLYRNGVLVANPDIQTLSSGSYVYVYNTTGNANYSATSVTDTLTITAPNPACYPLPDSRVVSNTSYQWNAQCTHINGLENVTVTCDDGYSLNQSNLNLSGANYSMTDTSNLITSITTCTITANSFTGEQTVYTQILTPVDDGQLIIGMCLTGTGSLQILWMIIALTLTLLVGGYVMRVGVVMFAGAIGLMAISWYIVACVTLVGAILAITSIFIIYYSMLVLPNKLY